MHFEFFDDTANYNYSDTSLIEATALYNPLLFFTEQLTAFSRAEFEKGEIYLTYLRSGWIFPNLLIHIPWFIIAVLSGLTGAVLFRRIKAENCGFLNTNKLLSNLTIFELCMFGSSLFLSDIRWNGVGITLGLGAAAAFVFYLIAEIFLKRNFLKILKSLYKFVAHMAVIAIIFTICATGAFGYGEYIPDASKIESVEVALPLSYSQITIKNMNYGWMFDSFVKIYEQYHPAFMPVMTDKQDINTVIEINRKFNTIEKDEGFSNQVIIRYNLKSGGYSERRHIITCKEELILLFSLFDTETYADRLTDLIAEPTTVDELKAEYNRKGWVTEARKKELAFTYEYSVVTARALSLQQNKALKLTEEQFRLLKDAVYKDLLNQTSTEYLLAGSRQLGVLSFGINEKAHQLTEIGGSSYYTYYDEPVSEPSYESNPPVIEDEEIYPDYEEETYEDTPVYSPYLYEDYSPYTALGGLDYGSDYDVIITENMTNTLALLESLGLSDCFREEAEIESVSFREYNASKLFGISDTDSLILEFFSYPVLKSDFAYQFDGDPDFKIEDEFAENKVTDPAKLSELDSLMRIHEFTFDSGFLCLVKYKDGTYSTRYLSDEDAPEYVRSFNYTKNYSNYYYYG